MELTLQLTYWTNTCKWQKTALCHNKSRSQEFARTSYKFCCCINSRYDHNQNHATAKTNIDCNSISQNLLILQYSPVLLWHASTTRANTSQMSDQNWIPKDGKAGSSAVIVRAPVNSVTRSDSDLWPGKKTKTNSQYITVGSVYKTIFFKVIKMINLLTINITSIFVRGCRCLMAFQQLKVTG